MYAGWLPYHISDYWVHGASGLDELGEVVKDFQQ